MQQQQLAWYQVQTMTQSGPRHAGWLQIQPQHAQAIAMMMQMIPNSPYRLHTQAGQPVTTNQPNTRPTPGFFPGWPQSGGGSAGGGWPQQLGWPQGGWPFAHSA